MNDLMNVSVDSWMYDSMNDLMRDTMNDSMNGSMYDR